MEGGRETAAPGIKVVGGRLAREEGSKQASRLAGKRARAGVDQRIGVWADKEIDDNLRFWSWREHFII